MALRRYRRRFPWRLGRPVPLLVAAGVALWFTVQVGAGVLLPTVLAAAEVKARALALDLVNRVVIAEVARGIDYADLVTHQTDQYGRVTLLTTQSGRVNQVVGRVLTALQGELAALEGARYTIPLGQALGNAFLAEYGPEIPVTLRAVGAVTAGVSHRFDEAGINQTRHTVLLLLRLELRIVVPLLADRVVVETEYPLAESIIVGPVPQWYGGGLWPGSAPPPPAGSGRRD